MNDIKCEIVKNVAVISTNYNGWSLELNLVSWNNRPAKLDLRQWAPNHSKQGKGVTLTEAEAKALCDALSREVTDV